MIEDTNIHRRKHPLAEQIIKDLQDGQHVASVISNASMTRMVAQGMVYSVDEDPRVSLIKVRVPVGWKIEQSGETTNTTFFAVARADGSLAGTITVDHHNGHAVTEFFPLSNKHVVDKYRNNLKTLAEI